MGSNGCVCEMLARCSELRVSAIWYAAFGCEADQVSNIQQMGKVLDLIGPLGHGGMFSLQEVLPLSQCYGFQGLIRNNTVHDQVSLVLEKEVRHVRKCALFGW